MINKILLILLLLSPLTNFAHWADDYNVNWNKTSESVLNNMPVGAGDMNCNVWVEKGDLLFYIQRSGSFNEIGEYIKLGRVRLTLTPNPFKNIKDFSQSLILKDGYIQIKAKGTDDVETKIDMWVDQYTHSVNLKIDANNPISYSVAYESWRTEDKLLEESPAEKAKGTLNTSRFGSYAFCQAPFDVVKLKDDGFRFDDNAVLFYHRNPKETMSPNYAIKQQELEAYKDKITNVISNRTMGGRLFAENSIQAGEGSGTYFKTDFKSLKLKSKSPSKQHHIYVATHIAQTETEKEFVDQLNAIAKETLSTKGNFKKNIKWWNDFWQRSWVVVNPDKVDDKDAIWQMGRNYNLMRYQFGGNAYGQFPTKFNGGSATVDEKQGYDPDWRKWGGDYFTAQNQRLIYWTMLKSGDFDMMAPQFELYMKALPGAMARVKESFGHSGAAFSENTDASGTHLAQCYGFTDGQTKRKRGTEIPFCDPRVINVPSPNKFIEKGVMPNPSVGYYYTLQLEFSYMILQKYMFDGESFEEYLPFINESLKFYDQHYQIRQKARNGKSLDENGKLVIFPSQGCEAFKGIKNPADVVSGLKSCLETLLQINQPYITADDKTYYKSFLARVPELPYGNLDGRRVMGAGEGVFKSAHMTGEIPMLYPLFPYNQVSLLDKDDIEVFKNVWYHNGTFKKDGNGWSQVGIFTARMGLTDEAIDINKNKLSDSKNGRRFPTYWGPNYDGTPDFNHGGSGMIGIQEMLMQTFGKKIILLPAWDKNIDVDFKLHAPFNTTVELSLKDGKIEKLQVNPKSRQKDIITNF